jgi:hypothetical protein
VAFDTKCDHAQDITGLGLVPNPRWQAITIALTTTVIRPRSVLEFISLFALYTLLDQRAVIEGYQEADDPGY